jgi:predicted transcriptional regulator
VRPTKAGSFSAYLEARQKRERSQRAPSKVSAISLLGILAETEQKELQVSELMSKSGMGFAEYAEALKGLRTAGFLDMAGEPGNEVVQLTPKGEEIALLSRSA